MAPDQIGQALDELAKRVAALEAAERQRRETNDRCEAAFNEAIKGPRPYADLAGNDYI